MKTKYLLYLLLSSAWFVTATVVAEQLDDAGVAKPIDHIVVVVNGECITRQELDEVLSLSIKQLQKQGIEPPPRDVLEGQVMEREILTRVQIQLANEIGMNVGDTELEKALNRIANANKMSKEEFFELLGKEGISYDKFREEIRNEMLLVRLKDRQVINKIKISDSDIDNFLYNQEQSAENSDEYQLSHIMIRIPDLASPERIEKKRKRAEKALAKLKNGNDFAQVAAEFSDAGDALEGGKLGWLPAGQLPTKFSKALKSLPQNELTPIIKSTSGFHILKLHDRRGGEGGSKTIVIDQTHVRHILIKVSQLTSENDAKVRVIRLKERLDNGSDFEELAKIHSEDPSGDKGGDLDWISPGDTVPEFEKAMDRLQPGEISGPVQSTFGWHLIQVIERRTKDVSNERQRQEATNTIRARKTDPAYQEWLQQLRDRAYVEYRVEDI
jgi:peptidyl-prolyl cis-trans isomerase SurA